MPLPAHIPSENGHKVQDMLQGFARHLQEFISEAAQKNEEVAQVISKELCERQKPQVSCLLGMRLPTEPAPAPPPQPMEWLFDAVAQISSPLPRLTTHTI